MASGMWPDSEIFMHNHQMDCRFRILVLGKVRGRDGTYRGYIDAHDHNSDSLGNLHSSVLSSMSI
jgi:hypothetical protein